MPYREIHQFELKAVLDGFNPFGKALQTFLFGIQNILIQAGSCWDFGEHNLGITKGTYIYIMKVKMLGKNCLLSIEDTAFVKKIDIIIIDRDVFPE